MSVVNAITARMLIVPAQMPNNASGRPFWLFLRMLLSAFIPVMRAVLPKKMDRGKQTQPVSGMGATPMQKEITVSRAAAKLKSAMRLVAVVGVGSKCFTVPFPATNIGMPAIAGAVLDQVWFL